MPGGNDTKMSPVNLLHALHQYIVQREGNNHNERLDLSFTNMLSQIFCQATLLCT